jgi:hypothetical protein
LKPNITLVEKKLLTLQDKCIVADDPDIKRGFGIPLNGLTPPVIIYLQGGGAANYFE